MSFAAPKNKSSQTRYNSNSKPSSARSNALKPPCGMKFNQENFSTQRGNNGTMEKCPSMVALRDRHNILGEAQPGRDKSPISTCSQGGGAMQPLSFEDEIADKMLRVQDRLLMLETQYSKLENEYDALKPLKKLSNQLQKPSTPGSTHPPSSLSSLYNTSRITPSKKDNMSRNVANVSDLGASQSLILGNSQSNQSLIPNQNSNTPLPEFLNQIMTKIDDSTTLKELEQKLNMKLESEIQQRCKSIMKINKQLIEFESRLEGSLDSLQSDMNKQVIKAKDKTEQKHKQLSQSLDSVKESISRKIDANFHILEEKIFESSKLGEDLERKIIQLQKREVVKPSSPLLSSQKTFSDNDIQKLKINILESVSEIMDENLTDFQTKFESQFNGINEQLSILQSHSQLITGNDLKCNMQNSSAIMPIHNDKRFSEFEDERVFTQQTNTSQGGIIIGNQDKSNLNNSSFLSSNNPTMMINTAPVLAKCQPSLPTASSEFEQDGIKDIEEKLKLMNHEMREQIGQLETFALSTGQSITTNIDAIKGDLFDTATRLHVQIGQIKQIQDQNEQTEEITKVFAEFDAFVFKTKRSLLQNTKGVGDRRIKSQVELTRLGQKLKDLDYSVSEVKATFQSFKEESNKDALSPTSSDGVFSLSKEAQQELLQVNQFFEHHASLEEHIQNTNDYMISQIQDIEKKIMTTKELFLEEFGLTQGYEGDSIEQEIVEEDYEESSSLAASRQMHGGSCLVEDDGSFTPLQIAAPSLHSSNGATPGSLKSSNLLSSQQTSGFPNPSPEQLEPEQKPSHMSNRLLHQHLEYSQISERNEEYEETEPNQDIADPDEINSNDSFGIRMKRKSRRVSKADLGGDSADSEELEIDDTEENCMSSGAEYNRQVKSSSRRRRKRQNPHSHLLVTQEELDNVKNESEDEQTEYVAQSLQVLPDSMMQFNSNRQKSTPKPQFNQHGTENSLNEGYSMDVMIRESEREEENKINAIEEFDPEKQLSTFEGRGQLATLATVGLGEPLGSVDREIEGNIYDQSEYSSVNTKVKNIPNTDIKPHYIGKSQDDSDQNVRRDLRFAYSDEKSQGTGGMQRYQESGEEDDDDSYVQGLRDLNPGQQTRFKKFKFHGGDVEDNSRNQQSPHTKVGSKLKKLNTIDGANSSRIGITSNQQALNTFAAGVLNSERQDLANNSNKKSLVLGVRKKGATGSVLGHQSNNKTSQNISHARNRSLNNQVNDRRLFQTKYCKQCGSFILETDDLCEFCSSNGTAAKSKANEKNSSPAKQIIQKVYEENNEYSAGGPPGGSSQKKASILSKTEQSILQESKINQPQQETRFASKKVAQLQQQLQTFTQNGNVITPIQGQRGTSMTSKQQQLLRKYTALDQKPQFSHHQKNATTDLSQLLSGQRAAVKPDRVNSPKSEVDVLSPSSLQKQGHHHRFMTHSPNHENSGQKPSVGILGTIGKKNAHSRGKSMQSTQYRSSQISGIQGTSTGTVVDINYPESQSLNSQMPQSTRKSIQSQQKPQIIGFAEEFRHLVIDISNSRIRMSDQLQNIHSPALFQNMKVFNQYDNVSLPPEYLINMELPSPREDPRSSGKKTGVISAYAASTNQGSVRNYNEDRVSIILNIVKPAEKNEQGEEIANEWPQCSFFGLYDGHGGARCADFLRDNLHKFVSIQQSFCFLLLVKIIREPCFPNDPIKAIQIGHQNGENFFLELAETGQVPQPPKPGETDVGDEKKLQILSIDPEQSSSFNTEQEEYPVPFERSGSTSLIMILLSKFISIIVLDQECYIANVGDSRALISTDGGLRTYLLSHDHRPDVEAERVRILKGGGQIYQTQLHAKPQNRFPRIGGGAQDNLGPHRVLPGRLSVSRTFGDIEAKHPKYGGNPMVVVSDPDILHVKVTPRTDFLILACDGVYDKLTNKELIDITWRTLDEIVQKYNPLINTNHTINLEMVCKIAAINILKASIARGTGDNVTCVLIGFQGLEDRFQERIQQRKAMIDPSSMAQEKRSQSMENTHSSGVNKRTGSLTERINRASGQQIDSYVKQMKTRHQQAMDSSNDATQSYGTDRLHSSRQSKRTKRPPSANHSSMRPTIQGEQPVNEVEHDQEIPLVGQNWKQGSTKASQNKAVRRSSSSLLSNSLSKVSLSQKLGTNGSKKDLSRNSSKRMLRKSLLANGNKTLNPQLQSFTNPQSSLGSHPNTDNSDIEELKQRLVAKPDSRQKTRSTMEDKSGLHQSNSRNYQQVYRIPSDMDKPKSSSRKGTRPNQSNTHSHTLSLGGTFSTQNTGGGLLNSFASGIQTHTPGVPSVSNKPPASRNSQATGSNKKRFNNKTIASEVPENLHPQGSGGMAPIGGQSAQKPSTGAMHIVSLKRQLKKYK